MQRQEEVTYRAGSSGGESVGAGFKTAVCGPDAAHACQTSAG